MKRQLLRLALGCSAVVVLAGQAGAVSIQDGYDPGFSTDPAPFAALILGQYVVENQPDDSGLNALVDPNYGGQDYDAEFMSIGQDGDSFDINIVSGQRQDNGFNYYSPGDIFLLLTDGRTIGIEVGGGPGGASGSSLIIHAGDTGSLYGIDSDGYTVTHQLTDPAQVAGSVWENPLLIYSPVTPGLATQFIGQPGGLLGTATYSYGQPPAPDVHAVIQVEVPLSLLGGADVTSIWWGPACGNDVLEISAVPEPTSGILAGSGLLFLLVLARKRRA